MGTLHRAATLAGVLVVGLGLAALPACGDDGQSGRSGTGPAGTQSDPGAAAGSQGQPSDELLAGYDRGLDFLASLQQDGKWIFQEQPHVGITALAVTNMLERPGGMRDGDRAVVEKGLQFLSSTIGEDGAVADSYRPNYETSVVIMALAASGDAAYEEQVASAARFIRSLQRLDEENPTYGGIGYGSDNTRSDVSNTQYAMASMKAAGISEDDPLWKRAVTFLSRTQNRRENEGPGEPTEWAWVDKQSGAKKTLVRGNDGGANYYPGNSKAGFDERPDGVGVLRSYGSMTYALLRCYHFAGLDSSDPRVKAAVDWIAENWSLDRNAGMPQAQSKEGLFYLYATIGKTLPAAGIDVLEVPGRGSVDWRDDLARTLLAAQGEDGSWVNSASARWLEGNPVLATAYALAALQGCVR